MRYKNYSVNMTLTDSELSRLNTLSFNTMRGCANRLGFPTIAEFYGCFDNTGFHGTVPDSMVPVKLHVDGPAVLDLMRSINGNISKYEMIKRYSLQQSNYYASYSRRSCPRLSTLLHMLPPDIRTTELLFMIEMISKRTPQGKEVFINEGYSYDGIPTEAMLVTYLMMFLKGEQIELSEAIRKDYINPYVESLAELTAFWAMSTKSFIKALEDEDLVLIGRDGAIDGDNSKEALLDRFINMSGSGTWTELVRTYPESRQGAVKGLREGIERKLQVATLLELIRPYGYRLSDLFEERIVNTV